ncbi:MAG: amidohydrolase family protein [Actinomycetota bacterium]
MSTLLARGAHLFTGVDDTVIVDGTVVIDDGVVAYAGPTDSAPRVDDADHLDADGCFLMPGMTESHAHLSYGNADPRALNAVPAPIAMLDAVDNAARVVAAGFTSAISFGSAQCLDIALRDVIASGRVPGPRLLANDRDLGSTGSNADDSGSAKIIADDPWTIRREVRTLAKKGVDVIKIFLDGEALSTQAPPGVLTYTDEEVAAAVGEAHARNMRVACHARSAAAVKQAVRHGIDFVGHANFLDDEAVDMLAEARDRLSVGPGVAWEVGLLERGHEIGIPREYAVSKGYQLEVDATIASVKRLREVGVRVTVGGDYGLSITPHGTQGKELEYFVDLFEMTPADALLCATRDGGWAFDSGGRVGTLTPESVGDLVIVDGDPLADIRVLQDMNRIRVVVKDGTVVARHGEAIRRPLTATE